MILTYQEIQAGNRWLVGALGVISDKFEKYIEKLDVKIATEIILRTTSLGRARLLQKDRIRDFEALSEI